MYCWNVRNDHTLNFITKGTFLEHPNVSILSLLSPVRRLLSNSGLEPIDGCRENKGNLSELS